METSNRNSSNGTSSEGVTFQVVFKGLRAGVEEVEAKARLAALFKATPPQIESLIMRGEYVMKRQCPPDMASRYRRAIEQAGGVCDLVAEGMGEPLDIDLPVVDGGRVDVKPSTQRSEPFASPPQGVPIQNAQAMEIFIGKNFKYFQEKWSVAERKNEKYSWNWPALLCGVFWLAYRKMYAYAGIMGGIMALAILGEQAFGISETLSRSVTIGVSVVCGSLGNGWYKLHAEKKVREILAFNRAEQVRVELARQGGTSLAAAFGAFALLAMLGFMLAVVAEG